MKTKLWLALMCVAAFWGSQAYGFAADDVREAQAVTQPAAQTGNAAGAEAQNPDVNPGEATELPPAESSQLRKLVVTVAAVEKNVRVRENETAPWVRPTVGMKLYEGAEVQTGLGSRIVLHIEPKQYVVVDRATSFKVVAAYFDTEANRVKTDLGMEYGRINYEVQAAGIDHDAAVHTPGNTLSIRGTVTFVQNDGLFPPLAASYTGRVVNTQSDGTNVTFGDSNGEGEDEAQEGEEGDKDTDNDAAATLGLPGENVPLVVQDGVNGPAENNITQTHNFSSVFGQTDSEIALDTENLGGGFSPDAPDISGRRDARGAIVNDQFSDAIGGQVGAEAFLAFTFAWMNNADLDSFVIDPLGQAVSPFEETVPGAVQETPQGGQAGPDHIGPDGNELIRWQGDNIPQGEYTYGLKYFSGSDDAPFKVDVIFKSRNGEPQVIDTFTGVLTSSNPEASRTVTVPPGSGSSGQ